MYVQYVHGALVYEVGTLNYSYANARGGLGHCEFRELSQ